LFFFFKGKWGAGCGQKNPGGVLGLGGGRRVGGGPHPPGGARGPGEVGQRVPGVGGGEGGRDHEQEVGLMVLSTRSDRGLPRFQPGPGGPPAGVWGTNTLCGAAQLGGFNTFRKKPRDLLFEKIRENSAGRGGPDVFPRAGGTPQRGVKKNNKGGKGVGFDTRQNSSKRGASAFFLRWTNNVSPSDLIGGGGKKPPGHWPILSCWVFG